MYPELGPDPGPHQKSGCNQFDKMVCDVLNLFLLTVMAIAQRQEPVGDGAHQSVKKLS